MTVALERLSNSIFDQPQLYHPRKAETFVRMFGPRLLGSNVTIVNGEGGVDHIPFASGRPSAGILGDRLGRAYDRAGYAPFDIVDGVAIIPVEGTLVQKGGWVGAQSGETSYQGLQTQIARARRDASVKGVVFEVDSFGGMLNGAFEAADAMAALSKEKPTIAILTDYAYSAAYLLASQARQVVMPEFGGAGSIGAVIMHVDYSGWLENEGVKITFIKSGRHKTDGNQFESLPDELRERWTAQVDAIRDRFATAVGKGRGRRMTKAAALKTEAECFTASEALDLGLVDAIGPVQEAFAAFVKEVNRRN